MQRHDKRTSHDTHTRLYKGFLTSRPHFPIRGPVTASTLPTQRPETEGRTVSQLLQFTTTRIQERRRSSGSTAGSAVSERPYSRKPDHEKGARCLVRLRVAQKSLASVLAHGPRLLWIMPSFSLYSARRYEDLARFLPYHHSKRVYAAIYRSQWRRGP